MNLREKAQNVARSYEEITADAEKYILAAIDSINDKRPTSIKCDRLELGGSEDGTHVHIIVDGESKVIVDQEGDKIKITLDDTNESVILNDKDSQEVHDLFLKPVREIVESHECPARNILHHILVMPLIMNELRNAGRDPMDITPRELKQLIDAKVEELKNSK